jgi:hypothetical protein
MRRKTHGGIKTLGSVLYLRTRSPTPRVQSPRNPPDGPREVRKRRRSAGNVLGKKVSMRLFQSFRKGKKAKENASCLIRLVDTS